MKTLIRLLVTVLIFGGLIGGSYVLYLNKTNSDERAKLALAAQDKLFGWRFPVAKFPLTGSSNGLIAYSTIRDPGGVPKGLPVRLKIPVIGVDSAIEDALITSDGRMDVPAGSVNVAWFALGPHPGQVGSAVIGGHYGIQNGVPFVFYNLSKVNVGDKVYVVDDKGDTLAFQVKSIKSFDRNADSTTVFTSGDGLAHLNLITCEGVWNQVNGNYPQRLVLFTDAIPSEGAVTVKPKLPATALTPSPVAVVTNAPSATSQALPSDSSTPIAAATASSTTPSSTPQVLFESAKSLYATPTDAVITSFLLFSIIFIFFKIIRR